MEDNKNGFTKFIGQQLFTALVIGIYILLKKLFTKYTEKYNFTRSEKWAIVIILYIVLQVFIFIFNLIFN